MSAKMTDRVLLHRAIKRAGSQSQLARETGITVRTINRWSTTRGALEISPLYRRVLERYLQAQATAPPPQSPQ